MMRAEGTASIEVEWGFSAVVLVAHVILLGALIALLTWYTVYQLDCCRKIMKEYNKCKTRGGAKESGEGEEEERLPNGWDTQYTDDGFKYYQHAESGATQWEVPTVKKKKKSEAGFASEGQAINMKEFNTAADRMSNPLRKSSADSAYDFASISGGGTASAASVTVGLAAPASPLPLPPGWSEHFAEKEGQNYYHHEVSGETVWVRPVSAARMQAAPVGSSSELKDKLSESENGRGVYSV
tara:strand:- start:347 stop:1066 length:720 start_codon:yes stop_codon:yes gene_type:complete